MTWETVPLGFTGHLLHKGCTLARLGGIADLPNIQKHIQRSSQNEDTKKQAPSERMEKNSKKKKDLKEMEVSNLLSAKWE